MQTRNKSGHEMAALPRLANHRAKTCPLCYTLNHPLSRECFNCGWCGAFPEDGVGIRSWVRRVWRHWRKLAQ